ncbi:hypothetical protein [Myroides odoratus]|uniref:hypothetical protein n=1 Tax=Myroides odoratus TaxID=256 RepID=UPI0039AE9F67
MKLATEKPNGFGIIQKNADGTISQIGLTQEQYDLLEDFLFKISEKSPLPRMPKQLNLVLESRYNKLLNK